MFCHIFEPPLPLAGRCLQIDIGHVLLDQGGDINNIMSVKRLDPQEYFCTALKGQQDLKFAKDHRPK